MPHPDAEKWDVIYAAGGHDREEPARVLKDFDHLLPDTGTALDLACGRGANALFLAQRGLRVCAWDISEEAIKFLRETAAQRGIDIDACVRDVTANPPAENSFDVIIVSYFLERKLMPALINALKPDGLLFYQTFIRERIDDSGPRNDAYRLVSNELLELCHVLHIVVYREEGLIGDTRQGFRNEAMLIGQKR